jgi:formylglycine-generating enzyme required for sulfatase activity
MLKPNEFGLFDAFGNIAEWRLDEFFAAKTRPAGVGAFELIEPSPPRGYGGGYYLQTPAAVGANAQSPNRHDSYLGFRPVKSLPGQPAINR